MKLLSVHLAEGDKTHDVQVPAKIAPRVPGGKAAFSSPRPPHHENLKSNDTALNGQLKWSYRRWQFQPGQTNPHQVLLISCWCVRQTSPAWHSPCPCRQTNCRTRIPLLASKQIYSRSATEQFEHFPFQPTMTITLLTTANFYSQFAIADNKVDLQPLQDLL